MHRTKTTSAGFSFVEIIIATAIILILVTSVVIAFSTLLGEHRVSTDRVKNAMLMEEGMEAVRSMRDRSWSNTLGDFSTDTIYYLTFDESASEWRATTTKQWIDGRFKRRFTVSQVRRDGNNDIASSGTVDPNTMKVTVTSSWHGQNGTTTKEISAYFTNLFEN